MADYYQMLGVSPQASVAEIRKAYALLAREKHPDRFQDPDQKMQAQTAFQDLTTAFNTLSNPRSRQDYDQSRDKPTPRTPEEIAQDAYQASQAALEAGQLSEAVNLLQRAVHHAPGEVAYQLALGRAFARAAGPQAAREAVQVLERVIQVAPQNAIAFAELAAVLARLGMRLRAQKTVEAGLRVAPRDARLLKLAAELGQDRR